MNKQVKGKVYLGRDSALITFSNRESYAFFVISLLRNGFEFRCNTNLLEVELFGEKV